MQIPWATSVMEGVEDKAKSEFVLEMGDKIGQGHFYGPPADAESLVAQLGG